MDETETQFEAEPPDRPEDVVSSQESGESAASEAAQGDEKVKMVLELFNGEVVRVDRQPKTR